MRSVSLSAFFALAFTCLAATASADQSLFTLHGIVRDTTGAPIGGARVTAAPEAATGTVSTVSDQRGEFSLALDPGRYTITVAVAGFDDASQRIVAGRTGDASRAFVMQLAGILESVDVTAGRDPGAAIISSATKTPTPLRDVPQAVTVVTKELIRDQLMTSMADVIQYVPGVTSHQGENNRDQMIMRGNSSSADFFVNGVRDDAQYYRDLYNVARIEALKGPNAMMFGRGGAGGVINRVTKDPEFRSFREVLLQGGSHGDRRVAADLDQPIGSTVAVRLNAMSERSDSFRNDVGLDRWGVTPTLTVTPGRATRMTFRYEHLHDTRVADRGITSFHGRPADVDIATFYGDPDQSAVRSTVGLASAVLEQRVGRTTIRNQTLFGDYDRFYQNFVPGAPAADGARVALTAYNNASVRRNLFNQTDVTFAVSTGAVAHMLLAGAEVGHQRTDNFRNTGFFNNATTSILVPFSNPLTTMPVTFRQNATDADNNVRTNVTAMYAQDQIAIDHHVQVLAGLRVDRFDLQYHNNRNGDALQRIDRLVSPRLGLVYKPVAPVSLYGNYTVTALPSSGDQFSALTTITQQVEPEKFRNYELGAKWDVVRDLSVTTAVYRLDRTNTRALDPNDPTRIVQTGSQRTNGYEIGVNGRVTPAWRIAGGYAAQDAFVTRATIAARAGAEVGQVPRHTLSLWNTYQLHPRVAAAAGLLYRSDMFATIDNTVTLPGYVRGDLAAYLTLARPLRLQVNVENVLNARYYINADSNTNISPGLPRTVRVGLTTTF